MLNKAYRPNAHLLDIVMHYNGNITVKPEMFTTFLFSRLSRIRKIREIKKTEKFYIFSYLTVKRGCDLL